MCVCGVGEGEKVGGRESWSLRKEEEIRCGLLGSINQNQIWVLFSQVVDFARSGDRWMGVRKETQTQKWPISGSVVSTKWNFQLFCWQQNPTHCPSIHPSMQPSNHHVLSKDPWLVFAEPVLRQLKAIKIQQLTIKSMTASRGPRLKSSLMPMEMSLGFQFWTSSATGDGIVSSQDDQAIK